MRKNSVLLLVAVGVTVLVAGCGGGSGTSGSSSSTSGGSGSNDAVYLAKVKAEVKKLLGKGSFEAPPKTAPAHEPGKTIAIIGTKSLVGTKPNMIAQEEAAKALGWNTISYDFKGEPTDAAGLIRSAIGRNVDAITLNVVDCRYVVSALREAKEAEIPVVSNEGYDCNETESGGEELYTATVKYPMGNGSQAAFFNALYRAEALYPIAKLNGEAHAIYSVDNTFQASIESVKTVEDAFAPCTGCSLVVDSFPISQFGNIEGRTEQLLLQHPETNAVIGSYAEIVFGGLAAAVKSSAQKENILLNGGESNNPATFEILSEGAAAYAYGYPAGWGGYAEIDTVLRLFAGQGAVNCGWGVNLFTATENVNSQGEYEAPYDYAKLYKEAWGVE